MNNRKTPGEGHGGNVKRILIAAALGLGLMGPILPPALALNTHQPYIHQPQRGSTHSHGPHGPLGSPSSPGVAVQEKQGEGAPAPQGELLQKFGTAHKYGIHAGDPAIWFHFHRHWHHWGVFHSKSGWWDDRHFFHDFDRRDHDHGFRGREFHGHEFRR